MSDIAIRVEGVGKKYSIGKQKEDTLRATIARLFSNSNKGGEEFWALKDISFEVKRGDVIGIIGKNGAGKSTLLKILSQITTPTTGRIEINGRVASLLEVGTGFHPELTGRENIFLNGTILGMTRREVKAKFDEIVDFSGVEKFIDTPVKHYSSGMYVRLAFAVAAHLEPEILIIDEVLAVGDAEFQKKCLGKMKDVSSEGRTVLFVSHNMSAIHKLCENVILLRSGNLYRQGITEQIIGDYLSDADGSPNGIFDLTTGSSIATRSKPILTRLTLSKQDGSSTARFQPDDEMIAEIDVVPITLIRNPLIAIAIEDSLGRRITTMASYFQKIPLKSIEKPCRVQCRLPRLGLGPGRYLLSVSIQTKLDGLIESLQNVASFEIVWQNNYGNGQAHLPVFGPVLSSSVWGQTDI